MLLSFSLNFIFISTAASKRKKTEPIKLCTKIFFCKLSGCTVCAFVIHTIKQSKWTRRDDDPTDGIECKRQARVLPKKKRQKKNGIIYMKLWVLCVNHFPYEANILWINENKIYTEKLYSNTTCLQPWQMRCGVSV